jgi:hypothetical protein
LTPRFGRERCGQFPEPPAERGPPRIFAGKGPRSSKHCGVAATRRRRRSPPSVQELRQELWEDRPIGRDPEPHRHPEAELREVPAGARRPRQARGLRPSGCLQIVFPIKDFQGTAALEFVSYHLEKPKYDVDECHQRGMTYAAPIKVIVRLVAWDKDEATGDPVIKAIKEQEVYFGEIPLMTENGTFIINGTERVIVSPAAPLARCVLRSRRGKTHSSSGKLLYSRADHPVPRLVARLRVRPQGHHLRPHRPPPEAAGHGAPARARATDTQELLDYFYREGDRPHREGRQARQGRQRRLRAPLQGSAPRAT